MKIPVYKVTLARDGNVVYTTNSVTSPEISAEIFRSFLGNVDREYFMIAMLNSNHKVIGLNVVSIGGLDESLIDIKSLFKAVLLANAGIIIICHNHPSGNIRPSAGDRKVTEAIQNACTLMHVKLLDHIILGDGTDQFYSFKENNIL